MASTALCQMWLLEFLITLINPIFELEHTGTKNNFFTRLEELREKHNKPLLKQELDSMEEELAKNDLYPYMYQKPQLVQRKGFLSFNKAILLDYFYNSIKKCNDESQTLLRQLDKVELNECEEAKVNQKENRVTRTVITPIGGFTMV